MAQVAMTVRLDSKVKTQFDALCEDFGMSANTAFNIFVKAVINTGSIPFAIEKRDRTREEAKQALEDLHKAALAREEPEMTLEEINEEIRLCRAERKARQQAAL
ncbi:MAG: type II toxin-antitoxin system RelB/DinJ family antitoxin [Bacteroidaceae bacterium]|nr:type II toxin-antitoxin system RelB/DinJ family antitoxin [Bacteroidaceae bacterium]